MRFEARPRRVVVALVGALATSPACVSEFDRAAVAGRPCPCLPGWVCDERQGGVGVCVERVLGGGGSAGSTGSDAGPVLGNGGGGSAGSTGSDAGPVLGNGGGGSSGGEECGFATPPTAETCPAECDECSDGTCHIRCDGDRSCSGTKPQPFVVACPPGLHCEVSCSALDSCKSAEVQCSGAQSCSVVCTGRKACMELTLACAEGPCALACGSEAQVCKGSALECGANACQASCEGNERPRVEGCADSCSTACGC